MWKCEENNGASSMARLRRKHQLKDQRIVEVILGCNKGIFGQLIDILIPLFQPLQKACSHLADNNYVTSRYVAEPAWLMLPNIQNTVDLSYLNQDLCYVEKG